MLIVGEPNQVRKPGASLYTWTPLSFSLSFSEFG